jgi:hypothetical protein
MSEERINDNGQGDSPVSVLDVGEAESNIKRWHKQFVGQKHRLRRSLKKNIGIKVNEDQYNIWKENSPKYLHVYMGLTKDYEPIFYLVDSKTDEEGENNEDAYAGKLFQTTMHRQSKVDIETIELPSDLPIKIDKEQYKEALAANSRALRWLLFSDEWFDAKNKENVVRAFRIDFKEFDKLFDESIVDTGRVMIYFAIHDYLKEDGSGDIVYKDEINLRIMRLRSGRNDNYVMFSTNPMGNVSIPSPPFEPSPQYNLIDW